MGLCDLGFENDVMQWRQRKTSLAMCILHNLQKVPNLFTYFELGLWPLHNIFITIMFVRYMIITMLMIVILIKINKFDVSSCMGVGIILVGCQFVF
jgi:hypothetical protein